jgi:hypothetical protein
MKIEATMARNVRFVVIRLSEQDETGWSWRIASDRAIAPPARIARW